MYIAHSNKIATLENYKVKVNRSQQLLALYKQLVDEIKQH